MSDRRPLQTRDTALGSSSSNNNNSTSECLATLANCCQAHHTHHERECVPDCTDENEEDIPDYCRDALRALSAILPKVERNIRSQAPPKCETLGHLCDFYDQVMRGTFCPHAPHLFKLGKDAAEVFPRVHFLLQNVVLPELIQNELECASNKATTSTMDTISQTTASFLAFLPHNLLLEILQGWIHLLLDLSILAESSDCLLTRAATAEHETDDSNEPIEVLLFDAVIAQTGLPSTTEYPIVVRDRQALLSLQAAILTVLKEMLLDLNHSGDEPIHNGGKPYLVALLEREPADVHDLLTGLRQALSSVIPHSTQERYFLLKARMAALGVLNILHDDVESFYPALAPLPINLLIVQAAVCQLQNRPLLQKVSSQPAYSRKLAAYLLDVATLAQDAQKLTVFRSILLDSVEFMGHAIDSGTSPKKHSLELAILHATHILLCRLATRPGTDEYLVSQSTFRHLFRLMRDPIFCDISTWILAALYRQRMPLVKLEPVFLHVLSLASEGDAGTSLKRRMEAETNSSCKRTRDNFGVPQEIYVEPPLSQGSANTGHYATMKSMKEDLRLFLSSCVQSYSNAKNAAVFLESRRDFSGLVGALCLLLTLVDADTGDHILKESGFSQLIVALAGDVMGLLEVIDPQKHRGQAVLLLAYCVRIGNNPASVAGTIFRDNALIHTNLLNTIKKLISAQTEEPWSLRSISKLPTRTLGTLYHDHLARDTTLNTCNPLTATVFGFGDVCLSINVTAAEGVSFGANWDGFFCTSIDVADEAQSRRLNLLGAADQTTYGTTIQDRTCVLLGSILDPYQAEPIVRLLLWQSLAWLLSNSEPGYLRRVFVDSGSNSTSGSKLVNFFLDVAFSDETMIQDYVSRELSNAITSKSWSALEALLANQEEWDVLEDGSDPVSKSRSLVISETLAKRFIHHAQQKLYSPLQPGRAHEDAPVIEQKDEIHQRVAIRMLLSLCQETESGFGIKVFELSLQQVVRIWCGGEPSRQNKWLCFAEIARLSIAVNIAKVANHHRSASFVPKLITDILLASKAHRLLAGRDDCILDKRKKQFVLLSTFIECFLFPGSGQLRFLPSPSGVHIADTYLLLEEVLPQVLLYCVLNKDDESVRLIVTYKAFLINWSRFENRQQSRVGPSLQSSCATIGPQSSYLCSPNLSRLLKAYETVGNEMVESLCLAPGVTPRALALVLSKAGQDHFRFLPKIFGDRLTLQTIVEDSQQKLMHHLIWEVGRDENLSTPAVRALIVAALIREHGVGGLKSDLFEKFEVELTPLDLKTEVVSNSAVINWVNSEFMYLLVNVVQYKWRSRSVDQQIQALQCLVFILMLLIPSDASQYYPQITSAFNAAMSSSDEAPGSEKAACVKFLAVQALTKYIEKLAEQQWEFLGTNLDAVVVSLIPVVLDCSEGVYHQKARSEALSLLEWLVAGEIGKKLAPSFSQIPFLPSCAAFDPMRESLRSLGVDFDSFVTTQGTQERFTRASDASEGGSTSSGAKNAAKQSALKQRLETVCKLLYNENIGVRRIALQHLTELLRGNRELFEALVENELDASMKHYVTVAYEGTLGSSRGTVTDLVEALLSRSTTETDREVRILLATSLGEVGAIGDHHLEERKPVSGSHDLPEMGPWHSSPARYELQLVTNHLVAALKAAQTSVDQHKIAFTIQQLLSLLDKFASAGRPTKGPAPLNSEHKNEMSVWLSEKLHEAGVHDTIEPFWWTDFCMSDQPVASSKSPPYFEMSRTYYGWISYWTRFMVLRSHDAKKGKWGKLFYACRSALRTPVGLGVAEYLLPVLVLDRICFGDGHDEQTVLDEMRSALSFGPESKSKMSHSERQKAVNTVLDVIDTFQLWSEKETESRHTSSGSVVSSASRRTSDVCSDNWPLEESIMRIDDVLQAIPLSLRASAAASVGMHARALRLFEMLARSQVSAQVFDATSAAAATNGSPRSPEKRTRSRATGLCTEPTIGQVLETLAALKEYETMECLEEDENIASPGVRIWGSIKRKEASLDWEGALQDYERALKLGHVAGDVHDLRSGALRCLLELGHFDSVLNQVNSFLNDLEGPDDMISIGIEAAWRLGNWDELSNLVPSMLSENHREKDSYESSLGSVMLSLKNRDKGSALIGIQQARKAMMDKLSIATGGGRAIESLVELQGLREIEDVVEAVCSTHPLNLSGYITENGLSWDRRLELVNSASAAKIMNFRLALARLAGDSTFEGSLFLNMGRRERKKGFHGMAASALAQAEVAFAGANLANTSCEMLSSLKLQFAKLKYDSGHSSAALRMLQTEDVDSLINFDRDAVVTEARKRVVSLLGPQNHSMTENQAIRVFAKNTLQSTQWMVEGGLKGGSEIISRFRLLQKVDPKWEKGHFHFAKYVDSILQSRKAAVLSRSPEQFTGVSDDIIQGIAVSQDRTCQRYIVLAMKHYAQTISLSNKHVYQALPRLLSLWFEFTSIGKTELSRPPSDSQMRKELSDKQDEANILMANHFKEIPASAFYTAMPQLISRITHADKDTANIVKSILRRVLYKYPAQAMWPLAWLRHSRQSERRRIGDEIFREAERLLLKSPNPRLHVLLVSSKSLFLHLQRLAQYEAKDRSCGEINVKAWKGEADLSEFIPPVQAALSASLSCGDSGLARDLFPRHVPRMRMFSPKVRILGSKARPKKLKAFVVSSDSASRFWSKNSKGSLGKDHDIGEIHFLVKQEKKGDLRKDARVQDLNNVINRLMATAASDGASGGARRLSLRTFAVTCLSEDSGILEWVPDTAPLRSLVGKAYNPQASPHSARRRGERLANFGTELRHNYERKCQPMYFENGDLKNAARLFEELCVKKNPPLFYWWFVQTFRDPHTWYEARTRFVLSSAAWSAVGHVIGLGDRHSENILVDTGSGECVHVDFDCIFDKGLYLPKPEVVPFRLTQNMLDAFGPTGADGVFSGSLKCAMRTLRDNRDTLLSVLEPFLKDPIIDWKRYRSQQQVPSTSGSSSGNKQEASEDRQTKEAKRSIKVIDERLRGIYNLRNPNLKRIKRSDAVTTHEDSELTHMLPLSVEGQVYKMIAEATSSENLVQMYVGWMPWI